MKSAPSIWHLLLHIVKSTVKISSISVAILENMKPCQKSGSSPQEKHAELFYWGSSFLNIQIPSRLYADFTQILAG